MYLLRYVAVILIVTIFSENVNGECANNCEWTSWFGWDCSRCCSTGQRFAIRQRGICCHNSTNPLVCLDRCSKQRTDMQEMDYCPPHCDECPTTTSKSSTTTQTLAAKYSRTSNQINNQMIKLSSTTTTNQLTNSIGQPLAKTTTNNGLQDCQMSSWSNWVCSYCCQPQHIAIRQRGISCRNTNDLMKCLEQCGKKTRDIRETGSCSSHCGSCPTTTHSTSIFKSSTTFTYTQSPSVTVRPTTTSQTAPTVSTNHTNKKQMSSVNPTTKNKIRSTQSSFSKTTSISSQFTSLISKHDASPMTFSQSKNLHPSTETTSSVDPRKHSATVKSLQTTFLASKNTIKNNPQTSTSRVSIPISARLSTKSVSSPTSLSSRNSQSSAKTFLKSSSPTKSNSARGLFVSVSSSPSPTKSNSFIISNQHLSVTKSATKTPAVGYTGKSTSKNAMQQDGSLDSIDSVGSLLSDGFPSIATIISSALADTGSNSTEECRLECVGKDTWDTCLKECFSRPCNNMLLLVSPCLFVLGVIVGTTITCIVKSLASKLKKNKRTGEDNSVLPFKEYF